ncbi:MAG: peptide ABC transporter substrate-binding protein [Chloroflexi bacterium]|nr:peptide ABC transporter substrate-binding protein [Chloroflexota bacterium]
MSSQNRMLGILLGVLALLVLVVGGLSAVLLAGGGDDDGDGGGGTTAGTTGGDGGGGDASASGRLRLSGTDPITLDPALVTDAGSAQYIAEIYSGLTTITPDLAVTLDLAESLDVTEGGLVYTFTLRPDVTFHNGRRVTAEDIAWSIDRALAPETSSLVALSYLSDIVGARERRLGVADTVEGLRVIDERTIEFRLDAPKPFFLAKLTYPTAWVVDRQQVEANPRNWTRNPNATGPYELKEWRLGERIVLEANDRFYGGTPKLEEVLYELSGGSTLTRFENGELDVASIGVNDLERAQDPTSDIGKLYSNAPQMSISYLAFNTKAPPFDDVNVRRAFAMAIDRQKIVETVFMNAWLPATGIIPPAVPGYTSEDKTFGFNPEGARAALAASRYGSAENLPAIIITEQGGGASAAIDTQAFLEQWHEVLGVDVQVRQTDRATLTADLDAGRLQLFNDGWSMDYPDPESVIDLKFHSQSALNDVRYENPEVDALIEAARVEQDAELRLQLYRDAEKILIDEAAWIPLYFPLSHFVVDPSVEGWFDPPLVMPRLRFISVQD